MNQSDYSEQLTIGEHYFSNTLLDYDNWVFAWFRETAAMAIDSGATQIDYTVIKSDKQHIQLTAKDNGSGMSLNALKQMMVLNYASTHTIVLFAHKGYQIHTRNLSVTGQGLQYTIEPADNYLNGTSIIVLVESSHNLFRIRQNCRVLAHTFLLNIPVSVNSKVIKPGQNNFDHELKLPVGIFYFNEEVVQDDTEVFYWVKLNGLPLFSSYLYSSGNYNIEGVLDLNKESAQFLTANHEGFKYEVCQLLSTFFHELSHSGYKLKSNLSNN